jgi:hypothetical protein
MRFEVNNISNSNSNQLHDTGGHHAAAACKKQQQQLQAGYTQCAASNIQAAIIREF